MKNLKFILAFAIFIVFAMAITSVNAAEVTVSDFESLKDAIVDDNASSIVLSGDIVVTDDPGITIPYGRSIILDLNGKQISMNSLNQTTSFLINNKGNLTIKDSSDINKDGTGDGKITFNSTNPDLNSVPSYASNTITNSGVIIFESGTIENTTKKAPAAYVIDNNSSGNDALLTINGGKINNVNNWGIRMFVNNNNKTNDIEMNNGYINGGIWLQTLTSKPKANFTVNNGTINGNRYAFYVYDPSSDGSNINIEINAGNFIANIDNGYAIYYYDTNSNLKINGGNFEGAYSLLYFTYNKTDDLTHIINDGTFKGYIELDQKFTTNQDENYNSNFIINNGKFSNDIYVWGHDGSSWYYSTNTKIINGGVFADIMDGEYDCTWPELVVGDFVATNMMKSTPEGYPYTIGYEIVLNSNFENGNNNTTIYTLRDGSMTELEDIKRDGYNFIGWNTKADGTGINITKDSIINESTTLYAKWEIVPGNTNTNVHSEDIKVEINEDKINDIVLTEEDKQLINEGKNIKIEVIVNDISDQILEADKKFIQEQINDKQIAAYIDISIIKTVDGKDATAITSTNDKLRFKINIPEEFIDRNNVEREYYIVRIHDGIVDILETEYDPENNTLTFETDKFSTYAIAYTEKKVDQITDVIDEDNTLDNNLKEETTISSSNPKTGDVFIICITLIVVLVIIFEGTFIYTRKIKNNFK